MSDVQDVVLEDLSEAVRFRGWVLDLLRPWLGDVALEIGSGAGDHAADLAAAGVRVVASEAEPARLERLRERFRDHDHVTVVSARLPEEPPDLGSAPDGVYCCNVLEHVADDVGALEAMARIVRPGGRVAVVVPAFQFAFSRFDAQVGHHRRYRRPELVAKFRAAGLEVRDARYVNAVGLVGWLLLVKLLRGRPRAGVALRVFELLVPVLARLERLRPPPFGQSLLVVGERPVGG